MNIFRPFLAFAMLVSSQIHAQDLCKDGQYETYPKGYVNSAGTSLNHLKKVGIMHDASEFVCTPNYYSSSNKVYTINQQADLLYFESYHDSTCTTIKTQGYYRLVYVDAETGYCWEKDLVWNFFDRTGKLTKKEFYYKDTVKKAALMPQPAEK